jgi:hypothetical protein
MPLSNPSSSSGGDLLAANNLSDVANTATARTNLELDPRKNPIEFDDFYVADNAAGDLGKLGWVTSGGSSAYQAGSAGHPGQVRRSTGSTINTSAYLMLDVSTFQGQIMPTETFETMWIVKPAQIDAFTLIRFGLMSSMTAQPTGGMYFERLAADTNWFAVCRHSSVETRVDTGHAAAAAWVVGIVRRIDASTIGFRIAATVDAALGATEQTITTNIPSIVQNALLMITNSEAASKSVDVDYWDLRFTGLSR